MDRFLVVHSYQVCSCSKCGTEQAYYFGTLFEFEVYALYRFNTVYCSRCFNASESLDELFVEKVDGVVYCSGDYILFSCTPRETLATTAIYLQVDLPAGILDDCILAARVFEDSAGRFATVGRVLQVASPTRVCTFSSTVNSRVIVTFLECEPTS